MNDSVAHIKEGGEQALGSADELRMAAVETHALARMLVKSAKRDLERRLEAHGVTVPALGYRVMRLLDGATFTLAELSRTLGIGATGLLPVIDTLEMKGFVSRGRDPKDRRRTPLSVTAAGRGVLAQVPVVDEDDSIVRGLAALGIVGSRELLNLLRDLVANVSGDEAAVPELTARLAASSETPARTAAKSQGV
jgi:DNA-binding MarR family transcriptional regulator